MLKKSIAAVAVAAALTPALGYAAEPTPEHTLTGNFGIYSQYIFRGLMQTDRKPALQGGFDYSHSSGFYAGTWASNISWLRDGGYYNAGGSMEWDFYGGMKGTFAEDFTWDVGTLYYYYPGTVVPGPLNVKADTWEIYGALGYKWLTAKYSYSVKDDTFAVKDSKGTYYFDLTATIPFGDSGFSAVAHYGIQKYDGTDPRNAGGRSNDNLYSYDDWKIGVTYAMKDGWNLGAFYTGTSGANVLGYGSVAEGGVYPRNIAKSTGTVFVQKTF